MDFLLVYGNCGWEYANHSQMIDSEHFTIVFHNDFVKETCFNGLVYIGVTALFVSQRHSVALVLYHFWLLHPLTDQ